MASDEKADTAERPKPSGRKARKLSQQEQSERFIETARELEADESGKAFARALSTMARKKEQ